MKCATRKYTALYLIGYFILINLLHLWLWNATWVVGNDNNITREFFILSFISLAALLFFFMMNLDSIQNELTWSVRHLVDKVRNLSPQNPWEELTIQTMSCDDELFEVVHAINKKSSQIQEYIDHLNQLIGYLWHEINTPLTVIQLCTSRIRKDMEHNDLDLIEDEVEQINKLTDMIGLLVWGDDVSTHQEVSIGNVVEKVVKEYTLLYPSQKITYINENDSIQNVNQMAVYTTIRNLVDNAVMHGLWEVSITSDQYKVTIHDQWKWIDKDSLSKIWLPFWKEDVSRTKAGSFGLGLSLVNQLCKQLWRDINASSSDWQWTTFTLSW